MNKSLPEGEKGLYHAIFTFCKPTHNPLPENEVSFNPDTIPGNSHLFLGKGLLADFYNEDSDVRYTGTANAEGLMDKVQSSDFEANNFKHALGLVYDGLAPLLSRASVMLDIPLNIFSIIVYENKSGNMITDMQPPYISKGGLMLTDENIPEALTGLASIYREATNSNSPNYQFLCFYRIIEGIEIIHKREERKNKVKGAAIPVVVSETIASDPEEQIRWLKSLFLDNVWNDLALDQIFPAEAVGKELDEITKKGGPLFNIRAKIAHTFVEVHSDDVFSSDKSSSVGSVSTWLPLCKCIAVHLLKRQYPFFFPKLSVVNSNID